MKCAICGEHCSRGHYVVDLQLIQEAVNLGATLREPDSRTYHIRCVNVLKKWCKAKTVRPVTD